MSTTTIASWLLTYLIHSTVLLGVAWLVSRLLGEHRLAFQETTLRMALMGGILTASLQVGLGVEPLAGALNINAVEQHRAAGTVSTTLNGLAVSAGAPDVASPTHARARWYAGNAWATALLTLWAAGSLLALLTLSRSALDLRRLLQTRCFRPAGRLVERLATAMGLGRRVVLSTSKAIAVPFATGIRKPEICCPERVCELAIEHQTGLFAHELAHLARRDPAWQLLYRLGEAMLFLQPLNRLVRHRLEEIAELLTDERAVACTGDRLGLARCLVVIAHWGTSSRLGVPATALASGPRLGRRVGRLLNDRTAAKVTPVWAAPLVACLLAAAALTLPVVASVPAPSDPATTKTWSDAEDAPAETPAPPDQPAPPDAVAPAPQPLPATPKPVLAPLALPAPEAAPANDTPSTAPSTSAPAEAPTPAGSAAPHGDATPPSPAAAPTYPRVPDEPEANPETSAAGERERARREAEDHRRMFERERAAAEECALQRMRQAEERTREYEERACRLAARAEERSRLVEERHEELRRQVDERRTVVEARAREMARTSEDRARFSAERAQELSARAAERAERSAAQRDELRRQAREVNRKAMEDARRLSEEARRLAEEAERKALEEEREKNE